MSTKYVLMILIDPKQSHDTATAANVYMVYDAGELELFLQHNAQQ